eukprot:427925-Pyramimonas_sp.AAC.1
MSWDSCSWLLFRRAEVTANHFMALAQAFGNRCSSTEPEFDGPTTMLRRIANIGEHAHIDIASALRSPLSFGSFV